MEIDFKYYCPKCNKENDQIIISTNVVVRLVWNDESKLYEEAEHDIDYENIRTISCLTCSHDNFL